MQNTCKMTQEIKYASGQISDLICKNERLCCSTILVCTSGSTRIRVNLTSHQLNEGDLMFLCYDIVNNVRIEQGTFSATAIFIPDKLMDEWSFKLGSMSFWDAVFINPVMHISNNAHALFLSFFKQIKWSNDSCCTENKDSFQENIFHNILIALDSELQRTGGCQKDDVKVSHEWKLCNRFYSLVAKHYKTAREVKFYAQMLHITTDYLYKITTRTICSKPKEIINQFVVAEMKYMLADTELSLTDIAEELHFEDSSYMCRFFRRLTGMSPMEFRNTEYSLR